jgi:tellurite resistance protein
MAVEFNSNRRTKEMIAEVMSSAVKGMLLVACVDDKLHWHEHQTLVESVRALIPHATAEELLQFLDHSAHVLDEVPKSQWPGLFEASRNLPTDAKANIMAMCTKMAFCDGELSVEESDLIHQITEWIDIDSYGRTLWKESVHVALNAAKLRGFKYDGIANLDRPEKHKPKPGDRSFAIHQLASRTYAAGDMEKCVVLLQTGANDGDAQSQALLGALYQEGDAGLEKDLARAFTLFEQAASQTNLLGTFLLARTYYLGIGVKKDKEQGILLFKRAAFMNFPDAQAMLGDIYRKQRAGAAWILVAAHNGHKEARAYVEERGDPPDDAKQLAARLMEAIQALKLLVIMNPELTLSRLAEMENEEF